MVTALAGWFVALAVLGLGFYVVRVMKPGSFRLRTSLLRVFSFSMEMESSGATNRPSDEAKHLPSPVGAKDAQVQRRLRSTAGRVTSWVRA